ncbi:MAG TPA: TlpA disulfide reductase family protein, partial [Candidatus Polarisedimenticolia bacterium]|nr:TlpA disulfide reductase family protein [Candidatus Polarisedimenticolia bacterium]
GGGTGSNGAGMAGAAAPGGDPFIDLVLDDPHGRSIPLADQAGKVRVFDVWATWCLPCREIIPHLNDLHERYRERGVVVIGIAVDSSPAEVVEFQREVPIRYLSGLFSPRVEAVLGQPNAVPTTYLIDRSGALRRTFVGIVDIGTLEKEIRALL